MVGRSVQWTTSCGPPLILLCTLPPWSYSRLRPKIIPIELLQREKEITGCVLERHLVRSCVYCCFLLLLLARVCLFIWALMVPLHPSRMESPSLSCQPGGSSLGLYGPFKLPSWVTHGDETLHFIIPPHAVTTEHPDGRSHRFHPCAGLTYTRPDFDLAE